MKIVRKLLHGVSLFLAGSVLMASSSLAFDNSYKDVSSIDSLTEDKLVVQDIYFEEKCTSCKYITVYDANDELIFDALVRDVKNIKDKDLLKILARSDYLMSNRIADFYILSK